MDTLELPCLWKKEEQKNAEAVDNTLYPGEGHGSWWTSFPRGWLFCPDFSTSRQFLMLFIHVTVWLLIALL